MPGGPAFHATLQSNAGRERECKYRRAAFRRGARRCDPNAAIAGMACSHQRRFPRRSAALSATTKVGALQDISWPTLAEAAAPIDSAYLLIDTSGRKRVTMLSRGAVAYDAIFPKVEFLARIPKSAMGKIQWMSSGPPLPPDGDGLLVVQNANDPTASVVLLRHGAQTLSARPADFNKIDLATQ